jgi:hypothetical protein
VFFLAENGIHLVVAVPTGLELIVNIATSKEDKDVLIESLSEKLEGTEKG